MNDVPEMAKLRWQCRRGTLELDFVLERYLEGPFATADAVERARFRELLSAQDPELQRWILNGVAHPDPNFQPLIEKIRGI